MSPIQACGLGLVVRDWRSTFLRIRSLCRTHGTAFRESFTENNASNYAGYPGTFRGSVGFCSSFYFIFQQFYQNAMFFPDSGSLLQCRKLCIELNY
jgi:hypothetical protein